LHIYCVTLLVSIVSGADVVMQNIANISPKTWNQMTKVRKILNIVKNWRLIFFFFPPVFIS